VNEPQIERRKSSISDEEFERIAARAAQIATDHFYAQIGKSVVRRFLYIIGTGGGSVAAWEVLKALKVIKS
jgi:hypothetical protein